MTAEEKHLAILQHTLGVDRYGQGVQYRNYFVTSEKTVDFPSCMAMVNAGLMGKRAPPAFCHQDSWNFFVTPKGREFVKTFSPKPPKLSKSRQRYLRYCKYGDTFASFIDYCRWDSSPERSWNNKYPIEYEAIL